MAEFMMEDRRDDAHTHTHNKYCYNNIENNIEKGKIRKYKYNIDLLLNKFSYCISAFLHIPF